jgi:hypothetical protein
VIPTGDGYPSHYGTQQEATAAAAGHLGTVAEENAEHLHRNTRGRREQRGDSEAAHRTALASLKHSFEKVGDHWEPKREKGPSDSQDAKRGKAARRGKGRTAGGVDAFAGKTHLMDVAKRLDITGRSKMEKAQLVKAIDTTNRSATAKSCRATNRS